MSFSEKRCGWWMGKWGHGHPQDPFPALATLLSREAEKEETPLFGFSPLCIKSLVQINRQWNTWKFVFRKTCGFDLTRCRIMLWLLDWLHAWLVHIPVTMQFCSVSFFLDLLLLALIPTQICVFQYTTMKILKFIFIANFFASFLTRAKKESFD